MVAGVFRLGYTSFDLCVDGVSFERVVSNAMLTSIRNFLSGCRLDMTAFRNLGGKYILYQGLSDQSVIPLHTRQVYARIRDIHGGEDETNKWMRYYEVPGVNHVSGGVGADTIAALAYLDNWVTKGTAPDYLVGQHVLTNGTVAF